MDSDVARLAAFSSDPRGGNPAGVYVCGELPPPEAMQEIAREVGYSETAFLAGDGGGDWQTRYFSPQAEVAFCGHATIAAAVHLHGRFGTPELAFEPPRASCDVAVDASGTETLATLTSVKPHVGEIGPSLLARLLALLGFEESELDPALPVRLAFAGVHHPIIALASRDDTERMEYDFDGLRALMLKQDRTTVQVIWRASPTSFRARNPFPIAGTSRTLPRAAAAALGAYLREIGAVTPPAVIEVLRARNRAPVLPARNDPAPGRHRCERDGRADPAPVATPSALGAPARGRASRPSTYGTIAVGRSATSAVRAS